MGGRDYALDGDERILTGTEREDSSERLAPKEGIGFNELPVWIKRLDDALAMSLEKMAILTHCPFVPTLS